MSDPKYEIIGHFYDETNGPSKKIYEHFIPITNDEDQLIKDFKKTAMALAYVTEARELFNQVFNLENNVIDELLEAAILESAIIRLSKLFVTGQVYFKDRIHKSLSEESRQALVTLLGLRHKSIAHSDAEAGAIKVEIGLVIENNDMVLITRTVHIHRPDSDTLIGISKLAEESNDYLQKHLISLQGKILKKIGNDPPYMHASKR